MDKELKIDPEFQNKIPPLTEEEYRQLEENILLAGRVFEPIAVWNGTIVDGHNRYRIVQENPGIEWTVREMDFSDKWDAIAWMCANQLGRRNIQDRITIKLLKGMMYEARKKSHGGSRGNQYTKAASDQNDHLAKKFKNTAQEVASELGTTEINIRRAGEFYNGMNAIEEEDRELAEQIKAHKKNVPDAEVARIGKARPEVRKQLIDDVRNNRKRKITKAETKELNGIASTLSDENVMEYTIDHLTEQIRMASETFIRSLSNLIMDHKDLCNSHTAEVVLAIDGSVTENINKIKERLNNGTQL